MKNDLARYAIERAVDTALSEVNRQTGGIVGPTMSEARNEGITAGITALECVEEDLEADLSASRDWFELKIILSDAIMEMTETNRKSLILQFISVHWAGHAPRSREITSILASNHRLTKERDRYKNLLLIKPIERKLKEK